MAANYNAENFNETVDNNTEAAALLNEVIPTMKWKTSEIILDVGSGSGSMTKGVLWPMLEDHTKAQLIGLDSCKEMIDFSKSKYISDNISYHLGNIEDKSSLPSDWQGKFHKIFSFYALQDVQSMRQVFENINWLLKDSGECCVVMASYVPLTDIQLAFFNDPKWHQYFEDKELNLCCSNEIFCHPKVEDAFQILLKQCGMKTVKCRNVNSFRPVRSVEELKSFCLAIDANQNLIPKDIQEEYKDFSLDFLMNKPVINRYTNEVLKSIDDLGNFRYHYTNLWIHAVKSTD